jgi:TolB-like protein/Tfp pilus assembly protein PilF/predicted Ser/Thr protein kinase
VTLTRGTRVGSYEVVALLGQGGMGEVYRARDTRLGRDVAIKILPAEFAADPQRRQRFEQEARAIAALNHAHICHIYDVGPDYLVLEYIEGRPVQGPIPANDALRLAIQAARALEAAHQRGILHRDLKPANILVTADGVVKLLDFGLAKLPPGEDDVTRTGAGVILGTPAYMSPEQAEGKPLDSRSDVFSFGVVLYEMLSGTRAFGGHSTAEVLGRVLRDDPPPPPGPPALVQIVTRCLAKQPGLRFQTIGEVRAALEQVSSPAADLQPSVAVLPFANMSPERENEYFGDGLAEDIINALSHIPGLKVTARTSAFAFRGKEQDIRTIAEALDVRTVLEGSVRRAGNRIRVTAQLINAGDGYHLWSERFDREMADVFAVQDEIASAIAAALQVKLAPHRDRRQTQSLPAYESYLKGLYYAQKWTPESLQRARTHFERAIAIDPQFAPAYSELGHCFASLAINDVMPAHEAMPLVRVHARQALEIDPSSPEAHAMMGMVAALYDYDWAEAERRFRLAIAREPVPSRVRWCFGQYCLLPLGRMDEALAQQALALRDDPLGVEARVALAVGLRAAGRDAEANAEFAEMIERDPSFWFPHFGLGMSNALAGQFEQARRHAETAYALAPFTAYTTGLLAAMLARTGDTERSQELMGKRLPGDAYGTPLGLALFHLLMSDIEKAADWTEKAIGQRQAAVLFFLRTHGQALRASSRWPGLAALLNQRPG